MGTDRTTAVEKVPVVSHVAVVGHDVDTPVRVVKVSARLDTTIVVSTALKD